MADKNFEITYTTSSQNIILKFDNNSRFNGPFKIMMAKSSVFLCGDKLFSVGRQKYNASVYLLTVFITLT